ncbi:outer membrane protein assembly factor BamA [candidate division KSB3 bacterium]|uniref:Outer membrane protein assembly factor BamA n=1 Tax=candidate division KSB3 bacterium TaxID=2044937 RepID=A0A2G6KEW9_9BACT|nr:MAG: outer membrane protein assembly factor BamA [candidate division KSB3 bacterium]
MKRLQKAIIYMLGFVIFLTGPVPHPEAWAQAQLQGIRTIVGMTARGNVLIPEDTILSSLESKVGAPFDPERLAKDIQHIYDIGFFSSVDVESRDDADGIFLIFIVQERPPISHIEFDGNDKINANKIEEVLTLTPSDLSDSFNLKFYPQKIKHDEENIRQLYHAEGYQNAQVTSTLTPDAEAPDERVILTYVIEERQKTKVRGISFEGNTAFPAKELEDRMATREKGFLSFITGTGKYEEATFQTDLERLKFFYADNGYLDAAVTGYDLDFRENSSDLFIKISLEEGDLYTIDTVAIEGNKAFSTEVLEDAVKVSSGDPFSRSNIRKDILAISEVYAEKGYVAPISENTEGKLLIDPKIQIDAEQRQVNLTYAIREGVPHDLGRVTISGNEVTRDKVIRRELRIQEGDLFNSALLERSQQDVFNLGLFDEANFNLKDGLDPNTIDLEIAVVERSTGSFNFGGGWSSLDSFVFSGGFSYANLFGLAHQINLSATLGSSSQTFNLNYTMPRFMDSHYLVGIDAYKTEREYTSYDSSSVGGGLRLGRKVFERIFATLKYEYREVDIKNVSENASTIIKESEGLSKTSSAWLRVSRSTINNVLLPTKGSRTRVTGEFAGGFLQGENDFYKLEFDNNTYFPIYKDFAFRFKTKLGYITEYGRSDEVPISERYFAGGADTIRGYEERSVGPKDENGEEIGGNTLALMSGEFIIPVQKQLRLVAFFDMGDVYGADENIDISTFRKSVGLGVRFFSPLGLIRLDWGYKLDRESGEDYDEFHFGVGALF